MKFFYVLVALNLQWIACSEGIGTSKSIPSLHSTPLKTNQNPFFSGAIQEGTYTQILEEGSSVCRSSLQLEARIQAYAPTIIILQWMVF